MLGWVGNEIAIVQTILFDLLPRIRATDGEMDGWTDDIVEMKVIDFYILFHRSIRDRRICAATPIITHLRYFSVYLTIIIVNVLLTRYLFPSLSPFSPICGQQP